MSKQREMLIKYIYKQKDLFNFAHSMRKNGVFANKWNETV